MTQYTVATLEDLDNFDYHLALSDNPAGEFTVEGE